MFRLLCGVLHIDWELVFVFQTLCDELHVFCGLAYVTQGWCLYSSHCELHIH